MNNMLEHISLSKVKRRIVRWVVACSALILLAVLLIIGRVQSSSAHRMFWPENSPVTATAILLGSTVGSQELTDRILTAAQLYQRGTVRTIVVSGDDGGYKGNEIEAMRGGLLSRKVPKEAIVADPGAYRTLQTCAHARDDHRDNVIIISQMDHLPRALYLCDSMGVRGVGVIANHRDYPQSFSNWLHEMFGSVLAWWEINVQDGANFSLRGAAALPQPHWWKRFLP